MHRSAQGSNPNLLCFEATFCNNLTKEKLLFSGNSFYEFFQENSIASNATIRGKNSMKYL